MTKIFLILSVCLSICTAAFAGPQRSVTLKVGASKEETVTLPPEAVFEGNFKGVASIAVAPSKDAIRFTGVKKGQATLNVLSKAGLNVYTFNITVED